MQRWFRTNRPALFAQFFEILDDIQDRMDLIGIKIPHFLNNLVYQNRIGIILAEEFLGSYIKVFADVEKALHA